MKAIVYKSNAGSTAQYASILGHELGLPVYCLEEAQRRLSPNVELLYLGWVMAGKVKGYEKLRNRYKILAVCAVGMGQTGSQIKEIREKNTIPEETQVFILQGNFDIEKLHGIYKMMMKLMVKTAGKSLAQKKDRTPEEEDLLEMMQNRQSRVKTENLAQMLAWYRRAR